MSDDFGPLAVMIRNYDILCYLSGSFMVSGPPQPRSARWFTPIRKVCRVTSFMPAVGKPFHLKATIA